MSSLLYFEDFSIGQKFTHGTITVTEQEIIDFAKKFDPQPMHIDPVGAKETIFNGIIASGWHTAAMSMRLFTQAIPEIKGGMIGRMIEKMEWPRPTRPNDTLRFECEVTEMKRSKSRPEIGIIKTKNITYNQNDEAVQIGLVVMVVPVREIKPN